MWHRGFGSSPSRRLAGCRHQGPRPVQPALAGQHAVASVTQTRLERRTTRPAVDWARSVRRDGCRWLPDDTWNVVGRRAAPSASAERCDYAVPDSPAHVPGADCRKSDGCAANSSRMRWRKPMFSSWRGPASTPSPVVIAAARDQKSLTQPCYFVLAAHLFDLGIPLGGASERMPSDFFRTSRCSKAWRSPRASAGSPLPVLRRCACLASGPGSLGLGAPTEPSGRAVVRGSQFGRHLGRAATTGAPQLQRLLFVLFGVSRLAASRLA